MSSLESRVRKLGYEKNDKQNLYEKNQQFIINIEQHFITFIKAKFEITYLFKEQLFILNDQCKNISSNQLKQLIQTLNAEIDLLKLDTYYLIDKQLVINRIENLFVTNTINCAQAIVYLATIKKPWTYFEMMNLARGFGGGLAGLQLTCGLLSGAVLAYATRYNPDGVQYKDKINLVNEILLESVSTTVCNEIVLEFENFKSKERKQKCNALLIEILELTVEDFI